MRAIPCSQIRKLVLQVRARSLMLRCGIIKPESSRSAQATQQDVVLKNHKYYTSIFLKLTNNEIQIKTVEGFLLEGSTCKHTNSKVYMAR